MKSKFSILVFIGIAIPTSSAVGSDSQILHLPIEGHNAIRSELAPASGTYQQTFASSLFSSLPEGGLQISEIYLYASLAFNGIAIGDLYGVSVELSTTAKNIDSLSPIFASNVSDDHRLFNDPGQPIQIVANRSPGHAVGAMLGVGKGFFYDPSKGNLLVQIKGLVLPGGLRLDAVQGSPFTSSYQSYDASSEIGELNQNSLVMGLDVTSIPEPCTLAILGFGITGICLASRRGEFKK